MISVPDSSLVSNKIFSKKFYLVF